MRPQGVNEEPAEEPVIEEPVAPTESPAVETPAEAAPEVPAEEPMPAEPTPEEQRIAALRAEEQRVRESIVKLRRERRVVKSQPSEPVIVPTDELKDVAPADVELIEKVMKAKGYVRKDEIQAQTYQQQLESSKDQWLQAHPEYLPENDPDDSRWNQLNETIAAFFKKPANPSEVGKVLDLAHQMIGGATKKHPVKSAAQTAAAQEKLKATSTGQGGAATRGTEPAARTKNIDTSYLIGFTDDELTEIASG
jgi:hypothetical protein